jgi:hypothetical protein
VATTGTLAGSMIEPEDEAGAEEAFTAALPAVAYDADAWDLPDAFLDVAMLADDCHPLPFGPESEGDAGGSAAAAPALEDLPLAVSGGAPGPDEDEWRAACEMFRGPEPYTPTAEDLAEKHAHREATECRYGYE